MILLCLGDYSTCTTIDFLVLNEWTSSSVLFTSFLFILIGEILFGDNILLFKGLKLIG